MRTESELAAAANLSFVDSYRKLAEHAAGGRAYDAGATFAFTTGVPIPLFNGCVVLQPVVTTELDAAVDWVRRCDVPFQVWIDDAVAPGLTETAVARGLELDGWSLPGMVLHPPPQPPPTPAGIAVAPVRGEDDLATWRGVLVDDGAPRDLMERLFPPSFAADPDVTLLTAHLDGRPVGTSIAIRTGDISGVYAVITLPAFRRRGVGTAAAWAAVNAGREWGCDVIALQATEMGFSSYARMGFKTVVRYATFNLSEAPV